MAQASHAIEQGKKLLKEGNKLAKGGFFSKSNPDEAEKKYEEARKKFRFLKPATAESIQLHLDALNCLSTVREQMNLNNSAAQAMEEAARACKNAVDKKMEQFKVQIPSFLNKAGYYYRLSQQYDLASDNIIKAANQTENIEEALKLLNDACEIHEDENRYITCHRHFDAAVKFCLENKRYKDAQQFIDRQTKMYAKDTGKFGKRIWRNVCSKMIIQFHLKQVKEAQNIYYEGMNEYEQCSNQDEQKLCQDLLGVFTSADEEALINIQKNAQLGMYFINAVSRIATKLNMTDIKPMIVNIEEEEKEKEQEKQDDIKEAENDVNPDQLKSDIQEVELDDDGAPNLIDM